MFEDIIQKKRKLRAVWTVDSIEITDFMSQEIKNDKEIIEYLTKKKRKYLKGTWIKSIAEELKNFKTTLRENGYIVYVDTTSKISGTRCPIGTKDLPVNNFKDAEKILENLNNEKI